LDDILGRLEQRLALIQDPLAHTLATVVLIPSKDLKYLEFSIGTWSCTCQEIIEGHNRYVVTMQPIVQVIPIRTFLDKISLNYMNFCDDGKNHYFQVPNNALDLMQTIIVQAQSCSFVPTHKMVGKSSPIPKDKVDHDHKERTYWMSLLTVGSSGLLLGGIIHKIFF
jgi:hypothetical protein